MKQFDKTKWVRVSRKERCKVCDHGDFCTRSADGTVAHCMRVESSLSCKGGGWIHRLSEPLPQVELPDKPPKARKDAATIAKTCCINKAAAGKRIALSRSLGVSNESLADLYVGVGWDRDGTEWASFPSRGINGEVVGITRRYDNGSKKTLAGTSNAGIFCKQWWWIGSGTVYIVEGASDVAALIDAGLSALGRPSCIGGLAVLTAYLKRRDPKRIVVIGENDLKPEKRGSIQQCPPNCNGCLVCWPGRAGCLVTASRLAKALKRKIDTLMPPAEFKDVRQWWIGNQLKGLAT